MPVHNWTRVGAGVFHDFHVSWIGELKKALNSGILPESYYAMAEQVAGQIGPDVLTLQSVEAPGEPSGSSLSGATAVQEAPPRVSITAVADEFEIYALKRKTLVIRHASGDRIVALVEILSPGNKDRKRAMERFLDKAVAALTSGYHLLLIDLHPPGPHDPHGIHGLLWSEFDGDSFRLSPERPLTLASYSAGEVPKAYVEPIAVGTTLPDMPLFIDEDWYVSVPLEATYGEAYRSVSGRWRRVLEEGASA